MKEKSKTY